MDQLVSSDRLVIVPTKISDDEEEDWERERKRGGNFETLQSYTIEFHISIN